MKVNESGLKWMNMELYISSGSYFKPMCCRMRRTKQEKDLHRRTSPSPAPCRWRSCGCSAECRLRSSGAFCLKSFTHWVFEVCSEADSNVFQRQLICIIYIYQSKHLKGRSVPCVSGWRFLDHKGFCRFPVSRHFPYSVTLIWAPCEWRFGSHRDFVVFLFLDTFWIQKCPETGKRQNPLKKIIISRDFVVFPVSRHFPYSMDLVVFPVSMPRPKASSNRRNEKIPWIRKSENFIEF